MELWVWAILLQASQQYLGLSVGEWIALISILTGIAASYAKLSEEVRELKVARQENKESIRELRAELDKHCDDEDEHMGAKLWAELMRRLDSLDRKIEQRNLNSGRVK